MLRTKRGVAVLRSSLGAAADMPRSQTSTNVSQILLNAEQEQFNLAPPMMQTQSRKRRMYI